MSLCCDDFKATMRRKQGLITKVSRPEKITDIIEQSNHYVFEDLISVEHILG
jgi:hypothetical protein